MTLSDIRDYVETLQIAEEVYMGKMDAKKQKTIGVYNSKHSHPYKTALGGPAMQSYGMKYVTFLVHWNKSPRDTEKAANNLFNKLKQAREVTINKSNIKFIQLLTNEPIDVGMDDAGIYEMVIEAVGIYGKEHKDE